MPTRRHLLGRWAAAAAATLVLVLPQADALRCPSALAADRAGGRDAWQMPDRVVRDLGLRPGDVVADVGCGGGYFTARLARAVGPKGKVWAEDISDRALAGVRNLARREGLTNVAVVKGEPTRTGLPDGALDAALIVNVYHHVPEKDRPGLTADVVRALKPGGFLYLIDWRVDAKVKYDQNRRIPKERLVRLMTEAGLVLDAEFHYLPHQVFLRFRKPPAK